MEIVETMPFGKQNIRRGREKAGCLGTMELPGAGPMSRGPAFLNWNRSMSICSRPDNTLEHNRIIERYP